MSRSALAPVILAVLLGEAGQAKAGLIDQYANSVIDKSSAYASDPNGYSASQALGAPNVFGYGDNPKAWAPLLMNGGSQYITLGFLTPVYATGVTIRENSGNGFVRQVDAVRADNSSLVQVWKGTDTSLPVGVIDFEVKWTATDFLVKGVKIYTDTEHNQGAWEEIDSVTLHGDTAAVPEPSSFLLASLGLSSFGIAAWKRRWKK